MEDSGGGLKGLGSGPQALVKAATARARARTKNHRRMYESRMVQSPT